MRRCWQSGRRRWKPAATMEPSLWRQGCGRSWRVRLCPPAMAMRLLTETQASHSMSDMWYLAPEVTCRRAHFEQRYPVRLIVTCTQSGCLMSRLQVLRCVQVTGRGRNWSCVLGSCCWPTCWSWSLGRLREPGYHRLSMTPTGDTSSITDRASVPLVRHKHRSCLQPWSTKPFLWVVGAQQVLRTSLLFPRELWGEG